MYGFFNIHVQRCSKMHKFFLVEQNEYWLTPNWLKSVQIKPQILFFVIQTVNAFNRKVHSKENHEKGSRLTKGKSEIEKLSKRLIYVVGKYLWKNREVWESYVRM